MESYRPKDNEFNLRRADKKIMRIVIFVIIFGAFMLLAAHAVDHMLHTNIYSL